MSTATRKLQIDVEVNLQQSKQALQQVVAQTAQTAQQITQIDKKAAHDREQIRKDEIAAAKVRVEDAKAALTAEKKLLEAQKNSILASKTQRTAEEQAAKQAEASEKRRFTIVKQRAADVMRNLQIKKNALREEEAAQKKAADAEKQRLAALEKSSRWEERYWKQREKAIKEEQRLRDAAAKQRELAARRAEKAEQQESRRAMFQAGGGLAAAYGVKRVASEGLDLAKEGAQALALDKSFKAIGYTLNDLDKVLAATGYNLDKVTVQRMVNLSHSFGFNVEQVTQFADIARAASVKTGQDMKWMFDSIVTGTARQSRLILDNLGILLDLSEAYRSHAATLGKTADSLTDYEKKQAVTNEVLRQGKRFIEQVPRDKLGESIGRTETAFKNFSSTMKGAFAQWFVWTTSAYTGTAGVSENLTRLEHKTRKYGEAVIWLRSLQNDADAKTNKDDIVNKALFDQRYLDQSLAGFGDGQMQALMQQKAFEEQFLRDTSLGDRGKNEELRTLMDSLGIHTKIRGEVEKVLDGTIATEAERRKVAKLLYEEGQRINKLDKESLDLAAQEADKKKEALKQLEIETRLRTGIAELQAGQADDAANQLATLKDMNAQLDRMLMHQLVMSQIGKKVTSGVGSGVNKIVAAALGKAPAEVDDGTESWRNIAKELLGIKGSAQGRPTTNLPDWLPDPDPKKTRTKQEKSPQDLWMWPTEQVGWERTPAPANVGTVDWVNSWANDLPNFGKRGVLPLQENTQRVQTLQAWGHPDLESVSEFDLASGAMKERFDAVIEQQVGLVESNLEQLNMLREQQIASRRQSDALEIADLQKQMDKGQYSPDIFINGRLDLGKDRDIERRNLLRGRMLPEERESFNTGQKAKWQETNDVFGGLREAIFNDPEQEKMKAIGEAIRENIAKPANIAADALRDITQGFANAGAAAIWEGKNFKKATNEMLRGIGQQATAKALFEGASALAALALGDVPTAILHGKAAAAYGVVAGVAALGAAATGGIRAPKEDKNEKTRGVPKARESSDGRNQTVIANTYYISYSGLSSDNDVRRMLFDVMNNGVGNNWLDSRLVEQR